MRQAVAQTAAASMALGLLGRFEGDDGASSITGATIREAAVRHLWNPVLLAIAYYLGARVGFLFQSPAVPQSVLWLPNSLLLAALLLSQPRQWPAMLIAAFPAQLLVGWQSHAPLLPMALLYLTNIADAMLGATLWRIVSHGEQRLTGLRPMLAFLVFGAAVSPLLLSFADAAITIITHFGSDYWLIYVTRARANVLTNVIFVPTALAFVESRRSGTRPHERSRYIEGALLCAGLIAATAVALLRPGPPMQAAALAFLPLPFLLWAAVRFGVCMTGVSLLVLAYISTWVAVKVTSPTWAVTVAIVPTLQFQLLAIAVPLLCLAAVVQERQTAAMALALSQHALHQSLAELRNVGGRLLTAAERERARVARELHDDVGQHLAVFAIGLNRLQRRLPDDALLRREVSALQRQALTVAEGVRALSHELHPGTLQHAGLVPAVRELCAQFEHRESMRAELTVQGGDIEVAADVALCAYRVTQEALRNAARHSGARTAKVTINATISGLELTVTDQGRGFDDTAVRQRGGLGLTSIDERVRLVGGTVDLATAPGHGTRIVVRLPRGPIQ